MVKKIKRRVAGPPRQTGDEAPPARYRGLSGQKVPPPADVEGVRLLLECGACGHVESYPAGTIIVDRRASFDSLRALGDRWGFTAYVRCRRCDAADGWRLTPRALDTLVAQVSLARFAPERARVIAGELRLFDGTVARFGAQAVAHLERLIAAKPDDPFLRDKLGNTYRVGGRPDMAIAAWEAAIALDPDYMPSLYSLGQALVDLGRFGDAVPHLHRCLLAARTSPLPRETKRELVVSALDASMEAYRRSGERTQFLPTPPTAPRGETGTKRFEVFSLDLTTERDRERLADLFLT